MRKNCTPRTEVYDRTWLLKARSLKQFRQQDVADAAGISVSAYCKIENGLMMPSMPVGFAIADFLNVSARNFCGERRIV